MTKNKKLIILVTVVSVALLLAVTGVIVVLVTTNQRAASSVNLKFTSTDVDVTLSATAYIGDASYNFTKNGVEGGEETLVLNPRSTEGSLSQPSNVPDIQLTTENDYVVFEYVFSNNTDDIDVKIDLTSFPGHEVDGVVQGTKNNIDLTYTYSDTKLASFDMLEDNSEYASQLLPAYDNEATFKYVYIKAQVDDLLYDSMLQGSFSWALSRPEESEINTVTLNVAGADYIERANSDLSSTGVTTNYTYRTFGTDIDTIDIGIYPAVADKTFIGWSETEGGTVISSITLPTNDDTHNALRGSSATTLYPVYKDSTMVYTTITATADPYEVTIGADSPILDNISNLVIPDVISYPSVTDGTTQLHKVVELGNKLYEGNTYIQTVHLGRYVRKIGNQIFRNCTALTDAFLGHRLESVGVQSFAGCTVLEQVVMPDTVNTFASLGGVFNNCTSLKTIKLPASLTTISKGCFHNSGLTSIEIPANLISITGQTFKNCSNLSSIVVSPYNKVYSSRGNCNAIIDTTTKTLMRGCVNTIMPSNLIDIASYAFSGCATLTSITIPSSVASVGDHAFDNCSRLTNVVIQNGVKTIGSSSFANCSALERIVIPDSVTTIGEKCFNKCSLLSEAIIGSGLIDFKWSIFYESDNLVKIEVSDSNPMYDSRENCNAIINTATNQLVVGCKETTFPASVTSIGSSAFYACNGLTELVVPDTIISIESNAFRYCVNLTRVELSKNLQQIGKLAFGGCSALSSITIPSSVTSIGSNAFEVCTGLLSSNGGSGIIFEDTTTWQKAVNDSFSNVVVVDVSSPNQNATWLVSTSGYYNYYWRKV